MVHTKQPFVDDELYVNEATLEALRYEIESEVKRTLQRTVILPLLVAVLVLILFGAFWLVPREIGTLLREDPIVNQRFREAAKLYLADPEGGAKVIHEQIIATVQTAKELQKNVDEAVKKEILKLNVDSLVKKQVKKMLDKKPLSDQVVEFLKSKNGQTLLTSATREYFDSDAGKKKLGVVTTKELQSENFRNILVEDLNRALNH